MAKFKTWTVHVNGQDHEIGIKYGVFRSTIKVDGEERRVKSSSPVLRLIDEAIFIDGKEIHLTVMGTKADVAVDGVYLTSGKPYVPHSRIPAWANVMLIVLFVVGWLFFGVIGMALGLVSGILTLKKSIAEEGKSNLGVCVVIYVVTMLIQIVGGLFINGLI